MQVNVKQWSYEISLFQTPFLVSGTCEIVGNDTKKGYEMADSCIEAPTEDFRTEFWIELWKKLRDDDFAYLICTYQLTFSFFFPPLFTILSHKKPKSERSC